MYADGTEPLDKSNILCYNNGTASEKHAWGKWELKGRVEERRCKLCQATETRLMLGTIPDELLREAVHNYLAQKEG